MSRLKSKLTNKLRRQNRVRSMVGRDTGKPRFSVFISNRHVFAQIVDDNTGTTLASASTVTNRAPKSSMTEKAAAVGKEIAKKAKSKKVSKVRFDRGPKQYHGRIKALADAAREEGLKF